MIPIRQETEAPQPSSPLHTNVADEAASIGVDVRHRGATTIVTSLDAGLGSGNINKTPSMPYDSPLPRVYTLGSDEGIIQHNELMDLVTKLSDRVVALETDLKQTKKVYGAAYTKLIMKRFRGDKGKGIMTESVPVKTKTKLQQKQERLGYKVAVRLQEEMDEEERQRMDKVYEETQSFS
nr:hypothetical protein [Tanacetum cinerariifolium]